MISADRVRTLLDNGGNVVDTSSTKIAELYPVSPEEVRLEREPITDADRGAATSGARSSRRRSTR